MLVAACTTSAPRATEQERAGAIEEFRSDKEFSVATDFVVFSVAIDLSMPSIGIEISLSLHSEPGPMLRQSSMSR